MAQAALGFCCRGGSAFDFLRSSIPQAGSRRHPPFTTMVPMCRFPNEQCTVGLPLQVDACTSRFGVLACFSVSVLLLAFSINT